MENRKKQRVALSIYFFLSGVCFSTWASRIPTIKSAFDLNEAELGNLLLTMPVSSLIGLPISGWLVSRFNSRPPLLASVLCFSVALIGIGYADTLFLLVIAIFLFSFCMRILNIAMNTQAITLQKNYGKKINGSFHGLWSTGGLTGVGFSTLMLKLDVPMLEHLAMVSAITFIAAIVSYRFLLTNDRAPQGNKLKLGKPDKFILYLGLLVFFAALCEGGMFDWSGVYFKEVIGEDIFTLGYFIFMVFMAFSRFISDLLVDRFGMKRMYIYSSLLISIGIITVIIFPYFWPAIVGFSFVGMGVASIIPMTFTLAGTSSKYSPGMAVSIIATYAIVGMLLGPPLIGYLANAFNLQLSFILFVVSGLMLIPVSQLFFRYKYKEEA
ncbi:MFS transporter [Autumnicola psychrophila]|uniref:MFS transporter n=1 Tax=Autumnicola psychrophila TaxID=3075592 RepID=A0ABU3DVE6_9FLAO|nr:MFS transporter [Zunongwangia sp. F225]MDT0687693.1 MFS transporter [Zunongwangia sp. F225]